MSNEVSLSLASCILEVNKKSGLKGSGKFDGTDEETLREAILDAVSKGDERPLGKLTTVCLSDEEFTEGCFGASILEETTDWDKWKQDLASILVPNSPTPVKCLLASAYRNCKKKYSYEDDHFPLQNHQLEKLDKITWSWRDSFRKILFSIEKCGAIGCAYHCVRNYIVFLWSLIRKEIDGNAIEDLLAYHFHSKWWTLSDSDVVKTLKKPTVLLAKTSCLSRRYDERTVGRLMYFEMIGGRSPFHFIWADELPLRANPPFYSYTGKPDSLEEQSTIIRGLEEILSECKDAPVGLVADYDDYWTERASWLPPGASDCKIPWKSLTKEGEKEFLHLPDSSVIATKDDKQDAAEIFKTGDYDKIAKQVDLVKVLKPLAGEQVDLTDILSLLKCKPCNHYEIFDKGENARPKGRSLWISATKVFFLESLICQRFEELLGCHPKDGHAGGVPMKGSKMMLTIESHLQSGGWCFCSDFDDFNAHHHAEAMKAVYKVLGDFTARGQSNSDKNAQVREISQWVQDSIDFSFASVPKKELNDYEDHSAKEEVVESVRAVGRTLREGEGLLKVTTGLCSGLRATDLTNTLLNLLSFKVAEKWAHSVYHLGSIVGAFHAGDDAVLLTNNLIIPKLLTYYMSYRGGKFQPSKQYLSQQYCDFLRRRIWKGGSSRHCFRLLGTILVPSKERSSVIPPDSKITAAFDQIWNLYRTGVSPSLIKELFEAALLDAEGRLRYKKPGAFRLHRCQVLSSLKDGGFGLLALTGGKVWSGEVPNLDRLFNHDYHRFTEYETKGVSSQGAILKNKLFNYGVSIEMKIVDRMIEDAKKDVIHSSIPEEFKAANVRRQCNQARAQAEEAFRFCESKMKGWTPKRTLDTLADVECDIASVYGCFEKEPLMQVANPLRLPEVVGLFSERGFFSGIQRFKSEITAVCNSFLKILREGRCVYDEVSAIQLFFYEISSGGFGAGYRGYQRARATGRGVILGVLLRLKSNREFPQLVQFLFCRCDEATLDELLRVKHSRSLSAVLSSECLSLLQLLCFSKVFEFSSMGLSPPSIRAQAHVLQDLEDALAAFISRTRLVQDYDFP